MSDEPIFCPEAVLEEYEAVWESNNECGSTQEAPCELLLFYFQCLFIQPHFMHAINLFIGDLIIDEIKLLCGMLFPTRYLKPAAASDLPHMVVTIRERLLSLHVQVMAAKTISIQWNLHCFNYGVHVIGFLYVAMPNPLI
jgi:hypothetical protein